MLGSGGARGLAHIGVIKWLEEHNYQIKSLVGCSIGSLIGGVYAAGKLPELEKWMCSLTKTDIFMMMDLSWEKGGFIKGDKVIDRLKSLIGDIDISALSIPYTAVAANIKSEKEVWINSGSLFDAIRASISLPLLLTPFEINNTKLIDGGILNPVPIAPAFSDNTDMVIAVNLGGEPVPTCRPEQPITRINEKTHFFQDKIDAFIEKMKKKAVTKEKKEWDMYFIADKAFDAMQSTIARLKVAAYPPDYLIELPRNLCGTLEFDRAREMINYGYEKASEILPEN